MFVSHKKFISYLLPYSCIFCKRPADRSQDICNACFEDLPHIQNPCPQCAISLPVALLCGDCSKNPPPFDRTFTLFSYEPPVTQFILKLKFEHKLAHAQLLGEWMVEKITADWYQNDALPEVIIPVPLHPKRLAERGFNQALEIARPLAASLKLPIYHAKRLKHTAAQATLQKAERSKNIKHAFSVGKDFLYHHVAVIDDVITTGETVTEFCRTLKKAGVAKIDVWSCARVSSIIAGS